ncbi:hypothetical protein [Lacticaseibacillus sharpeae]|uniref:Lipoprotein n=1 Tax=Lacticaseibacillus sharpeae JCM 1186 = DSM 20505 TaxID=1291052 RepID=A0A0R1ZLB7_9LACO|nr:hypothetical protein [Lacticaseibacillus sharpeae]KRM55194.1 hypothetical protein FC18_GL001644 [Lacticaseibacillus sharpeae JCM 1186 = DSM 20505]
MMMKKNVAAVLGALALTALLTGCGVQKQSASSSSSTTTTQASKRTPRDLLSDCKKRGLPVKNVTNATNLPSAVKATSGVTFVGGTKTNMMLLKFSSQADANSARTYYVGQNKRVYSKSQLLLVADYGMAKAWFAKYQRAIYR